MSLLGTSPQHTGGRIRFSVLDSWRGVCAILVALYHVDIIGAMYAGHLRGLAVINNGFLFVDFFFVLSGFVIAHSSAARMNGAADIMPFLIRRFGRVWPLHMATLLALIGLELLKLYANRHGIVTQNRPFAKGHSVASIFTNIFLVHSLGIHSSLKWNVPSWSISVEFYTYVIFALLLAAWPRRLPLMSAILATIGALVVAEFSRRNMQTTVQFGFFRCLYGFFVGVLTYLLYRNGQSSCPVGRLEAVASEIAIVTIATIFVAYASYGPISLLSPMVFGATVYVFSWERGMVSTLLLTRPFRAAGEKSYSIYMTHAILLSAMADVIKAMQKRFGTETHIDVIVDGKRQSLIYLGSDWRSDAMVVSFLVLLFVASSITYKFIENHARMFFNNIGASKWRASRHPPRAALPGS